MRSTKHAPRDPYNVLERRYGLAEIFERGAGVKVEYNRVSKSGSSAAIDRGTEECCSFRDPDPASPALHT